MVGEFRERKMDGFKLRTLYPSDQVALRLEPEEAPASTQRLAAQTKKCCAAEANARSSAEKLQAEAEKVRVRIDQLAGFHCATTGSDCDGSLILLPLLLLRRRRYAGASC